VYKLLIFHIPAFFKERRVADRLFFAYFLSTCKTALAITKLSKVQLYTKLLESWNFGIFQAKT
jgi:hypothetical protein